MKKSIKFWWVKLLLLITSIICPDSFTYKFIYRRREVMEERCDEFVEDVRYYGRKCTLDINFPERTYILFAE